MKLLYKMPCRQKHIENVLHNYPYLPLTHNWSFANHPLQIQYFHIFLIVMKHLLIFPWDHHNLIANFSQESLEDCMMDRRVLSW